MKKVYLLTALAPLLVPVVAFAMPPEAASHAIMVSPTTGKPIPITAPGQFQPRSATPRSVETTPTSAAFPTVKVVAPADMRVKVKVSEATNQVRVTVRPPSALVQARALTTLPVQKVEPAKVATPKLEEVAGGSAAQARPITLPSHETPLAAKEATTHVSRSEYVEDNQGHVMKANPVGTFGGAGHPETAGSQVPPGMVPPSQQPHSIAFAGYARDSARHSPGSRPPGDGHTFRP